MCKASGLEARLKTQIRPYHQQQARPANLRQCAQSAVQSASAEHGVCDRHYVHPHRRRLGVSGHRARPVRVQGRGVVHGAEHACRTGLQRLEHGHPLHPGPSPGLVVHSDRGSQYASALYQELLDEHGFVCSMSRKGKCWDTQSIIVGNAIAERFFLNLKIARLAAPICRPCQGRHHRLHRRLLQRQAIEFSTGQSAARRLRGEMSQNVPIVVSKIT